MTRATSTLTVQSWHRASSKQREPHEAFSLRGVLSVITAVALFVAGFSGAAGFALMFGTVVEIIGAMITGKQGNDTEQ